MSIRTWMIEKLGGVTKEELEARGGWEVVVDAMRENRENSEGIITPDSSMRLSAVFACVRVLSEAIASVPLHHYERMQNGERMPAENLPIAAVLKNPNPFQTGFEYFEVLMKYLTTWGNAYSQIEYDARGTITELWPLPSQNIIASQIKGDKRFYQYQEATGKTSWLSSDIIWHLRGLGDGLNGYSPIGLMRRAVALGLSAEEFGKRFFDNDARPGIVLEHPGKLSDKATENLKKSWNEEHKGVSKTHRIEILEEGMKLHEVGIPPEDAQFLETRKFQVTEIARIMRVPPHMIADLERSTNNNIEHQGIEFVKYSILPWAKRIEESIHKFLYLPKERSRYYAKFLLAGLERGDINNRYTAYGVGRQNGWLSANDIRKLEDMDPVNGGDVYLVPLNMVPAVQVSGKAKNEPDDRSGDQGENRTQDLLREERSIRSVTARYRIAGAYKRLILDAADRAMKRETNDIDKAVKKYLGKRSTNDFLLWLEAFYQEHIDFMTRQFFPLFLSYAETIAAEAQDEIAAEGEIKERLERFVKSYSGTFAAAQAGISLNKIKTALQEAMNNGLDLEVAMENEMAAWRDIRPSQIATEHTTRAGNAVAKFVYVVSGIVTLRFVTMGDTCPFCKGMDGKTISINKNFLSPGEEFMPAGAISALTTTTPIGHPPLHDGCDCMIMAG